MAEEFILCLIVNIDAWLLKCIRVPGSVLALFEEVAAPARVEELQAWF